VLDVRFCLFLRRAGLVLGIGRRSGGRRLRDWISPGPEWRLQAKRNSHCRAGTRGRGSSRSCGPTSGLRGGLPLAPRVQAVRRPLIVTWHRLLPRFERGAGASTCPPQASNGAQAGRYRVQRQIFSRGASCCELRRRVEGEGRGGASSSRTSVRGTGKRCPPHAEGAGTRSNHEN
jgi:hypothetical protein